MGASSSSSPPTPPGPTQQASPVPSTPSSPAGARPSAAFRPSVVPGAPPPSTDIGVAKEEAPNPAEDTGPGTFEDLHRKCKGSINQSINRQSIKRSIVSLFSAIILMHLAAFGENLGSGMIYVASVVHCRFYNIL